MVEKAKKLVIICMVGTPCSGKSTWILKNRERLSNTYDSAPVIVISRDDIREEDGGKEALNQFNKEREKRVTDIYYKRFSTALQFSKAVIILDNCHMPRKYIEGTYEIIKPLVNVGKAEFFIKKIHVSYPVAWVRNIHRRIKTGKWIPKEVMSDYFARWHKLDLSGFNEYPDE
jgi:hypothetical protein